MHIKIITITLLSILTSIAIFVACETKPTQPEHTNVYDPNNPTSSGDPFQLQVAIGNGGVTLTWTKPATANLANFKIYRSENETTGYAALNTVSATNNQYVDQTVQNGYSYWYSITALDGEGNETSTTNVSSMNIKTDPLLVINSGDQYTSTKEVNLTILANIAQKMMISNVSDFSGANWETYSITKNWTLLTGDGEKIIYMKVKYDTDIESNTVQDSITLDTTPPIPILVVSPDSGITDETSFQFDPTGSYDNIFPSNSLQVRFDWENDGNWDAGWQLLSVIGNQYAAGGGDKIVKMEIQDGTGWSADTTTQIFINTRPLASFTPTQDTTNYSLFHFDASASTDYEDSTNLQYRWDFDGDGNWDTGWLTQDTISYLYSSNGDFLPKLVVRDLNNLMAEISIQISAVSCTDVDGNTYLIVKIGNQWWMAENLKVTHYRNGDAIPNVTNDSIWTGLTTGAYCNYNNDLNDRSRLYNWYAVDDSRNIAPQGWHVPTDDEWKQLEMYLGMSQLEADDEGMRGTDEGGKMKALVLWQSPNTGATNSSGFWAIPGGSRHNPNAMFSALNGAAYFWSSTEEVTAWYRELVYYDSWVFRLRESKHYGFSVRCVRD